MKCYKIIVSVTVALSFFTLQTTKADVIADWTFETSQPGVVTLPAAPGAGVAFTSFSPEIGTGTATALHASASTYSSPTGHGSAHSFSSTAWSIGDYYQFSVSTLGFTGISIYFEQISSGTGPGSFDFQYSTNGSSFTTFQSYSIVSGGNAGINTWSNNVVGASELASEYAFDLSAVSSLTNQSSVYFRLVDNSTTAANGTTVAAGGTDRVDDFTVSTVPEPSTMALAAVGGMACLFAVRRRR